MKFKKIKVKGLHSEANKILRQSVTLLEWESILLSPCLLLISNCEWWYWDIYI